MINENWLPGTRAGQIVMCRNWIAILGAKAAAWGIPAAAVLSLETACGAAQAALDTPDESVLVMAQREIAFEELIAVMQDLQKRYFSAPPLTDADLAGLAFKFYDPARRRTESAMTNSAGSPAKQGVFS